MSNSTKSWYALFTKPGCEKKVANLLARKNIENYCPLKQQWNGKRKLVLEPLFNSFVFVQIGEDDLTRVRMTDSVINFVYWLGKPARIQDEEIDIMKQFLNEYSTVKIEKIPFDVEGMDRVIAGPLADRKEEMISVKNNTVKIVLPSLGYTMLAEVEKSTIEVITSAKPLYTIVGKYQYAG